MDLIRLIYISESLIENQLETELISILDSARAFNSQHNISGVLLHRNGEFIQCLEGQRTVINRLYGRITHDSRHHKLRVVDYERIPERRFSHWYMRYADTNFAIELFMHQMNHRSLFDLNHNGFLHIIKCLEYNRDETPLSQQLNALPDTDIVNPVIPVMDNSASLRFKQRIYPILLAVIVSLVAYWIWLTFVV